MAQLCVLVRRKLQPDASAFLPDCFLNFLTPGDVQREATTLHEFEQLALIAKQYRARQSAFFGPLQGIDKTSLAES